MENRKEGQFGAEGKKRKTNLQILMQGRIEHTIRIEHSCIETKNVLEGNDVRLDNELKNLKNCQVHRINFCLEITKT